MKDEVKIRMATEKDAAKLLEIYAYYVENTAITFEWDVPSISEFADRIKNTLQKYPYYVATVTKNDKEKIIGYAYASAFKTRAAYDWAVETWIYIDKDCRRSGTGKLLLEKLESTLQKQNITNVNACIAYTGYTDTNLTNDSMFFHEKMGYVLAATFHQCGYKFNKWYDLIWMEKMIGEHTNNQKPFIPFSELKKYQADF